MIIKTRVFELYHGNYQNLSELARAMGLSVSQVYRVRNGKRHINQKFIIGAKKVFPNYRLDELFYLEEEPGVSREIRTIVTDRYLYMVQQYTGSNLALPRRLVAENKGRQKGKR